MSIKDKAIIATIVLGVTTSAALYTSNIDFRRDVNNFGVSTFFNVNLEKSFNSINYKDANLDELTYYVHDNGQKKIISTKKYVEGYKNIGVYDNKTDDDLIAYVCSNYDGERAYTKYSISSIETSGIHNFLDDSEISIIDENSPEGVSATFKNFK